VTPQSGGEELETRAVQPGGRCVAHVLCSLARPPVLERLVPSKAETSRTKSLFILKVADDSLFTHNHVVTSLMSRDYVHYFRCVVVVQHIVTAATGLYTR